MRYLLVCMATMILFITGEIKGENIYIAQTAQGSDNGAGAANARAAAWFNTAANWGTGAGKIGPGDTVHLCGTISTSLTMQGSGTTGSAITIFFEPNAKLSKNTWTSDIMLLNGTNYITIDGGTNGIIEATDNGTAKTYHNNICGISSSSATVGIIVKNITIKNLYTRTGTIDANDYGTAIYIRDASNFTVQNCTFDQMHAGVNTSVVSNDLSGFTAQNVNLTNMSWHIVITQSANYDYSNIIVDGCTFDGAVTWDQKADVFHSDYIHTWSSGASNKSLKNVTIKNNILGGPIGCGGHLTSFVYLSDRTQDALIYNNVFQATSNGTPTNGLIYLYPTGNQAMTARIYNNTFVTGNTSYTNGINDDVNSGSSLTAYSANNIFNGHRQPYYFPESATLYSDYNNFYNMGNSLSDIRNGMCTGCPTTAENHSNADIVNFLSNSDFKLQSNSAGAVNKGINESTYFATDKNGVSRPQGSAWDIGAYEYVPGTAIAPAAPNRQSPSQTNIRLHNTDFSVMLPSSAQSPELTVIDLSGRTVFRAMLNTTGEAVCNAVWRERPAAGAYFAVVKETSRNDGAVLARTKFVVGR